MSGDGRVGAWRQLSQEHIRGPRAALVAESGACLAPSRRMPVSDTAIANAVFHATGVRVRALPITLEKVAVNAALRVSDQSLCRGPSAAATPSDARARRRPARACRAAAPAAS